MKVRFDFVTNSSSSSFVFYRIDDKEMADVFVKAGYSGVVSGSKENVISGQFLSERTGLDTPQGGSIVEWFIRSMKEADWDLKEYSSLIDLLNEHKDAIDHNCRSAEFAASNVVSDGDSSFESEERRGAKIILSGIEEADWDYEKEGEGLWSFIEGDTSKIRRKAKELNGTTEYKDPWLKEEKISRIFDSPEGFSMEGQVVCLTGDFDYGSKSAVKSYIEGMGGSVSSSVSKKTTVVLVGNKGSAAWSHGNYGTKIEKAIERKRATNDILILQECAELLPSKPVGETKTATKKSSQKSVATKSMWSIKRLPDGNYEIEKYKGKETTVEIPSEYKGSRITSIGEEAFSGQIRKACTEIERIKVPEGIVSIKELAFDHCSNLKEIELPDSLTEIGEWAFQCTSLEHVILPRKITIINKGVFAWCKSLISVELPERLESIGPGAFGLCKSLTNIQLPQTLETLGEGAFGWCNSLETVHVPDKTHLDIDRETPFGSCLKLKEITISENNKEYASVEGVLFDKTKKTIVCYPIGKGREYSIPNGVEVIGNGCFQGSRKLTLTIPDSVMSIGKYAIYGCMHLTICAHSGSCAEKYAKEKNFSFIAID